MQTLVQLHITDLLTLELSSLHLALLNMKPPVSASGAGTRGPITGEAGNLGYMEICMKVKNEGWKVVDDANGPYAYGSGNQWVGYDTIKSVTRKAEYVKTKGLGGAMFWDLATDDFNVSNNNSSKVIKLKSTDTM